MNKLTVAALVAVMGFAGTAFANVRPQAQKAPVKTPAKTVAPKGATGNAVRTNTDALLSSAKQLKEGKKLSAEVSAGTCDPSNSIVSSVASVLKGSEKTAFLNAIGSINYNGQEILQPCQAGQPITGEDALKNLAKMATYVGNKVQKNEGSATDVNLWAEGLRKAIPGIKTADSVERIKGLASSECKLLNLSI